MVMVLVMSVYCIAKELVQISQQVLSNKCHYHILYDACAHKSGLRDTSSQVCRNMFRFKFAGSLKGYSDKVTSTLDHSVIAVRIISTLHSAGSVIYK